MIRKFTTFSLVGLLLFIFIACKKSSTSDANPATSDSVAVLGKWKLIRDVEYRYSGTTMVDSSHSALSPSDYFNFSTNGLLYLNETYDPGTQPTADTVAYRVLQNHYLAVIANRPDTLKITFGNNSLMLTQQFAANDPSNPSGLSLYDTIMLVR